MGTTPIPIEVPKLPLNHSSIEEHCSSLISLKRLSYWWYQGSSGIFGNYSLPFIDREGNWWFQAKPGLCWPVESFKAIEPERACPPISKSYVGYQHILPNESGANSFMVIDSILDLKKYGTEYISSNRRGRVRKGLRTCSLERFSKFDKATVDECRAVWNDLSLRTGWRQPAGEKRFGEEWRMLLDCPGVTIILAREKSSGQVAGFYITKVIGDTAYGDTVAVHSDMLSTRANDALLYGFLVNASQLVGVSKASAAITSTLTGLEKYKAALGYEPCSFPARMRFRPGLRLLLRLGFSEKYNRLLGRFNDDQVYKVDAK